MKQMEKVLVLNGSFCEIPIIETCHALGYYVITTGNAPNLIGHQYADEYISADYSDCEEILNIVKAHNIKHVLSCANDFGSITAAYVSEQMGWEGHDSYSNSMLLHHKDLFKEYIQRKGYPTPFSKVFTNKEDAIVFANNLDTYPIIVKANDLTGGKGILKADNVKEAIAAIENAFIKSRSKHILIEPFVVGDQQTFVTFLHNKKVVASNSCDSYSFINPYLIQAETLPAKDINLIEESLIRIIEEMASDLNLADGIFAFQYIRNGCDFSIIEMMRRPFGNQFLKLVEYGTTFPWHLAQVVAETGGDWSLVKPKVVGKGYFGHYGVMIPSNGRLKSWSIPDDIQRHIIAQFVMKEPGDEISDYLNERVAFLHFQYDDYAEMQSSVATYNNRIKVELY